MAGGHPTDYKPEYPEQARKLCLLGYTDVELAGFFEVCERTINNWKVEHPEFLQSIKSGKVEADEGSHDDLAMSMALCMYVRKYDSSRLLIETSKTTEQSLEMTSIINTNSDRIALFPTY